MSEMTALNNDFNSLENAFIIVYGRRRVGKTRLLDEFFKDKKIIKYTAVDTNKKVQLDELKTVFADYLDDDFLRKQEIVDWSSFFSYLSKVLDKEKTIYIWIDEFTYLIKNDQSITSTLQKFIDEFLRNSKVYLVVSGSLFGLMSEKVLSSSSPLYGRRTRDILLKQIPVGYINEFLNFDSEDLLRSAFTIGGIPEYLIVASKYNNYIKFINNEFFKKEGYFFREPYYLLSQEFKEIKTYFSILNSISYGNTKPTHIANFVGIKAREIYPYLELLINYGFVKRISPIIENNKGGTYTINDVFFDFWFNFVHKNRELIEKDNYEINISQLNSFFGKRFEIFIIENFNLFFSSKMFSKYGKWWGNYRDDEGERKEIDMDILALNEKDKEILFGECKWKDKVNVLSILNEMKEKIKYIEGNNEKRKESYAVFAKSFSKKVEEFDGKKVYCFDLNDIEKILKR